MCIQPTYEELKHPKRIGNMKNPACIQPTYEELKQAGEVFL